VSPTFLFIHLPESGYAEFIGRTDCAADDGFSDLSEESGMGSSLSFILGVSLILGPADRHASGEEPSEPPAASAKAAESPHLPEADAKVPEAKLPDAKLPDAKRENSSAIPDAVAEQAPIILDNPMSRNHWFPVWGYVGARGYVAGDHMAPNGLAFHPVFTVDLDFNIGILPDKKLYMFGTSTFWAQRAQDGLTQDHWDFTKREWDAIVGAAVNYWGPLEFRFFGYSYANLNRGNSKIVSSGYNDGVAVENRYYLPTDDIYDIGRLGFLSLGYYPSKVMVGGDGSDFKPGFFARAYLTYDLPFCHSYVYGDGQLICEDGFNSRLGMVDAGIAARPFPRVGGFEARVGGSGTFDVQTNVHRGLAYFGFRLNF